MNVLNLRKTDPVRSDELGRRGAWAARRAAPTATAWADAFGHSRQHGARAVNGDPNSAAAKNLRTIYLLATGDETTALSQVMEEWALMKRLQIETLTNDQLRKLLDDLDRRIPHADARKNVQAYETRRDDTDPDDDETAAEADMEAAEYAAYRAEAKRERAARKRKGEWS